MMLAASMPPMTVVPMICRATEPAPVAVHNGTPEVRRAAHYTTKADGGKGAARELVEVILKSKGIWEEMIDKARA